MHPGAPRLVDVAGVSRSSMLVAAAASSGQLVTLLLTPIMTRLYEPGAFGVLAAALAVVSIGIAVSSLRYDYAIPVAPSEEDADALLVASVGLVAVVAAMTGVAWAAAAQLLEHVLGQPVAGLVWLVAGAVFVGGTVQALTMWNIRRRQYGWVAAGRFGQSAGIAAAQVGLGVVGAGTSGLVAGDVIGRCLGSILPLHAVVRALHAPSARAVLSVLRTHAGLAGTLAAAALLNAAAFNAPFLLLPAGFGAVASGMYFLAYRVLALPAGLVGSAIGQVLLGDAAAARREQADLEALVVPIAAALLAVALPAYTAVAIAGPELFGAVFGAEWRQAGEMARILSPAILLWAVASPLSGLLVVARRERESLAVTAVELLTRLVAIGAGIASGSLLLTVVLVTGSGVALNVAAVRRFLLAAGVGLPHLARPAATLAVINIPGAAVMLLATRAGTSWTLLVAVVLAILITIVASIYLLPELRLVVRGRRAQ